MKTKLRKLANSLLQSSAGVIEKCYSVIWGPLIFSAVQVIFIHFWLALPRPTANAGYPKSLFEPSCSLVAFTVSQQFGNYLPFKFPEPLPFLNLLICRCLPSAVRIS